MSDTIHNETTEGKIPGTSDGQIEEKQTDTAAPVEKSAETAQPAEAKPERSESREHTRDRSERRGRRGPFYEGSDRESSSSGQMPRVPKFKKKFCSFCQDKNMPIDYKRPEILERFVTDRGKILPRRVTGTCSKHQRIVAREIKRARIIALLPFVEQ